MLPRDHLASFLGRGGPCPLEGELGGPGLQHTSKSCVLGEGPWRDPGRVKRLMTLVPTEISSLLVKLKESQGPLGAEYPARCWHVLLWLTKGATSQVPSCWGPWAWPRLPTSLQLAEGQTAWAELTATGQ